MFKWFWLVAQVGHGVKKVGFQNATFKNLLVWNYKAQSFHIWYIASSSGPLPQLFKLYPCGQNWPRPGGHSFILNYIRKSSKDYFSWIANGNLTKLNRYGPWVVLYQICSNGSDWLHKLVTGSKTAPPNGRGPPPLELPIYWTKQWTHHLLVIDQCIYQTHQIVTYYKWRIYHTKYFFTFSKKMFYIYFIYCYLKRPVPRTGVQNKNNPGEKLICVHIDLS